MAKQSHLYDLMLLLSTELEDERRAKILSDVETQISRAGAIERNDRWGSREMAYQIDHQREAEYHLLQFSGPPTLLEELSHSLGITDGVLRFRIIKVLPGTPPPPAVSAPGRPASAPAPAPVAASAPEPAAAAAPEGAES